MSLLASNSPLPNPTPAPASQRPVTPPRTAMTSSTAATQTPPFLTKLFQLVSDPSTDELVAWSPGDGSAFTVHKPSEFGHDVLPKYFKHNNFSSFVRQLNQYGFHKQNPDRWMFGHDSFRRGRPDLLTNITRRRPKPQGTNSSSSSHAVVAPSLAHKAVVELGNYGIEGEVKALKRDKDLLIKELVVTRQAEEKLKDKCDNLENRMQSLEKTSGQMQAFIMHYFSQVLQPYSDAMASRKRKRITSSPGSDMLNVFGDATASSHHSSQRPSSRPSSPPPPMDALRVMMQQMQMNVARSPAPPQMRPPPPRQPPPLVEGPQSPANAYAPATVQELPHEELPAIELGSISPLVDGNMDGDSTVVMGDDIGVGRGGPAADDEVLGFLEDMSTSPNSSLTMDAIESALKEPNGRLNGRTHLDTPDYGAKSPKETNGHLCDDSSCDNGEKVIEDFLALDPAQTTLPPPLLHLPEGTDVHALAMRIEGFMDESEKDGESS